MKFTLKMVTVVFAETLEEIQQMTQSNPKVSLIHQTLITETEGEENK
jgi:hypothetical protein